MWIFIIIAIMLTTIVVFGFALSLNHRQRLLILLGISGIFLLLSYMIPAGKRLVFLFRWFVLLKFYDLHYGAQITDPPTWRQYLAFLMNPFTLVQRRLKDEPRPSMRQKIVCLVRGSVLCVIGGVVFLHVFDLVHSSGSFVFEHVVKTVFLMVIHYGFIDIIVALWRLPGWCARRYFHNFFLAPTPADFWRRYNRLIGQLLYEDVFKRVGGRRAPLRATLIVFAISGLAHEYFVDLTVGHIQGLQLAFFLIHGCAVAATLHTRPKGWKKVGWITGTMVFNLATSVLFFASVAQVFPWWYSEAAPAWIQGG